MWQEGEIRPVKAERLRRRKFTKLQIQISASEKTGEDSRRGGTAEPGGDRREDWLQKALQVPPVFPVPGRQANQTSKCQSVQAQCHSLQLRGDHQEGELGLPSPLIRLGGGRSSGTLPWIFLSLIVGLDPVSAFHHLYKDGK